MFMLNPRYRCELRPRACRDDFHMMYSISGNSPWPNVLIYRRSKAELVHQHQIKSFEASLAFVLSGPDVAPDANAVLNIGMARHELIVNWIRFGQADGPPISILSVPICIVPCRCWQRQENN